ncbi:peptidase M16 inactive domain protein [delta proteobacterium NaphS2]|nr:peptidase M16 inactive domain protein [delta proteobacterium NaphS2]
MKVLTKRKNVIMAKYFIPFLMLLSILTTVFLPSGHAASVTEGAKRYTLENGLTVILKEDHSAPVTSVQVWVKTGSANETPEEAGITHQIEHMIFKGTPTKGTGEIARAVETAGGRINAYTSFDRTVYYVEIDSARLDTALDVLLDAVQNSVFDPEELKKEKEVVLEEYRRSLDIPENQLSWTIMRLAYKKHPYGRPIIGYEKTIRSFNRKMILKYVDKWYTPKNMVVVAVGDFETEKVFETIKKLVRNFPERTGAEPARPKEPPQTELRKTVINNRVQQAYLDICWHIPALTHKDIYALDVLESILGDGKSSRLYTGLKMDANLVYHVSANTYALADPGLFSVDATLKPEKLKEALAAIGKEISRVARTPVDPSELDKAKTTAEASFVFDMEDMAGQASTLGYFQTMTGDMYHADDYLARIKQVTAEDILRVSQTYLRPENLSIGIMVPEGQKIHMDADEVMSLFKASPAKMESPPAKRDNPTEMRILKNGMRVIIKENKRVPEVSVVGVFLGGKRLEKEGEWGISDFVAEMLTRGTRKRTAADIAATVESWAGSLDGFSGRNSVGVSGKFLSKDLYAGLDLLSDVVLHANFPSHEIEKVREDILAAIRAKKDRPTAQLFELFYKTLYPHYPYGHPSTGTPETINRLTRAELEAWYESIRIPSNFVLAIVGDLDRNQLVPYLETLFEPFRPSSKILPELEPEPPLTGPRKAHLKRPGAQTHMTVGYLGAELKSINNAPMALVDTALSGMGGRLFSKLRDRRSLAYSVTAFRSPGLETGSFGVYLACDPDKLQQAEKAVFAELALLRDKGLTEKELTAAKRYLLGNLKIGMQTNGSQALQMALDELYGMGFDHMPKYIERIESVTTDDINRAVKDIILPDRYVFVTVGPG